MGAPIVLEAHSADIKRFYFNCEILTKKIMPFLTPPPPEVPPNDKILDLINVL